MRIAFFPAALLISNIATAAAPIDGLYSSLFGGYTYLSDNLSRNYYGLAYTRATYNGGYNAGGRFGYKSYPMRYEGEITFLSVEAKKFSVNGIKLRNASGHSDAATAMVNVYYDFPEMVPCIAPFLGAGLGYAWVDASLKSNSPFGQLHFKGSNSVFAYQGTLGLTYNFAENYALDIAYRFIGTERPDDLGKVFKASLASISAIYRFDEANYK